MGGALRFRRHRRLGIGLSDYRSETSNATYLRYPSGAPRRNQASRSLRMISFRAAVDSAAAPPAFGPPASTLLFSKARRIRYGRQISTGPHGAYLLPGNSQSIPLLTIKMMSSNKTDKTSGKALVSTTGAPSGRTNRAESVLDHASDMPSICPKTSLPRSRSSTTILSPRGFMRPLSMQ